MTNQLERALVRGWRYAKHVERPVFVYRSPRGFLFDVQSPVMGERWEAKPDGTFAHVKGPVI